MRLKRPIVLLVYVLYLFESTTAELLSLIVGTAAVAGVHGVNHHKIAATNSLTETIMGTFRQGGGLLIAFKDKVKCKVFECCDAPYINPNFELLKHDLRRHVFGQHIVLQNIVPAIEAHWNGRPLKPLVMSFHGYTGCGKNYVASLIAENLFKNGMKSRFVHHIVASAEFPDRSRVKEYEEHLRTRLLEAVKTCDRTLFILDEVDKMPETLLSSMKSYMDYYQSVQGADFRKSIFIFLSNKGSQDILDITIAQHEAGKERNALLLSDFEGKVAHDSFNRDGGLKKSEIISNHLIDHYLPFLPLERSHVEQCILAYFERQDRPELGRQKDKIKEVADQLKYFPSNNAIYSSSGCKRVATKADLIIATNRLKETEYDVHDDL